jgi:transglutaminase-like putative cysteine protease
MQKLALDAQSDLAIRELAEKITNRILPRDYASEYAAVLNWVRRNIRYVRDPVTVEQVQTPRATLEVRSGDCDDASVLIAAMVGHLGGRTRFSAGAFKRAPSGRPVLAHVWVEALDPVSGAWVVLDPVPGRRVHQMLGNTIQRIFHPGVE